MEGLLEELNYVVVNQITKFTDNRIMLQTCKYYNKLCNDKLSQLTEYYKNKYKDLSFTKYFDSESKIELFTLELVLDSYEDKIPECYYNYHNKIICAMLSF